MEKQEIIGVNELDYLFDSNQKDYYNIQNKMEQDLYRISKATKDIDLKKDYKYIIKAKTLTDMNGENYTLNQIEFETEQFFKNRIIYCNKEFKLNDKSRVINFYLQNGEVKSRFIIDSIYLRKVLNELKSPSFTVKVGRNSNVSINDFKSTFDDISIVDIFCEKKSYIMTIENFRKRDSQKVDLIKDINLNMQEYFKEDSEKIIIPFDEYDQYYNKLMNFLVFNEINIMYFLGPKGCSKSLFLNLFAKKLIVRDLTKLYINMKYVKEVQDLKTLKKTLYKEFLYSITEEEEIETVYNWRIFDQISLNNSTNFVYKLIEKFINLHEQNLDKEIVVIIDNYIIENESEQSDLEEIIDFMNKKNHTKYKLIISGDGKFFRKKLKYHFLNEIKNLKFQQVLFMNFNKVPKFDSVLTDNNAENNFLLQEEEYLNKYDFYSLFYCFNYNQKKISLEELNEIPLFETFPNYLDIYIDNQLINFKITSNIYLKALNKKIAFNVEKNALKSIMEKKYFPRTSYGVAEELLIILLIKYNKFNIGYMNFKEIIEVEEINEIKNFKIIFKSKIKELEKQECYLITQKKYNEENYEILIIQNIDNKINAIFVQIGVDKNKNEIINIKNDLAKNVKNYKNGL